MEPKERKIVFGIIAVMTVIIIIALVRRGNNRKLQTTVDSESQTTAEMQTQETTANEEYTKIVNGDVKLNTSSKLSETKTIDGLEISNIQLTKQDGKTQLLADVKNTTSGTKGGYAVSIKLIDKDGKEITTMHGYIGTVEAGQTTQLNCSKTVDCANAYDFEITKE